MGAVRCRHWSEAVESPRYRHTCKNQGNHDSDARRFFERALAVGTDSECAGDVIAVTLNSWKPEA
jgi:hypothetical protein